MTQHFIYTMKPLNRKIYIVFKIKFLKSPQLDKNLKPNRINLTPKLGVLFLKKRKHTGNQ